MKREDSFILSFIFKPVMSWVLNILIIVVGLVSFNQLPIRMYPALEVPMLYLETNYGDAGADVIESQITRPIEEALMGVSGLKEITSQSTSSNSNISLFFYPWVKMGEVYNQVQTRVMKARASIDTGRIRLPETRIEKSDPNSSPMMWLMLFGEGFSSVALGDAAVRYVKSEIESIAGVATVPVFGGGVSAGSSAYKMDIVVSPDKLHSVGLTVNEVIQGVKGQIYKMPFGLINDGRFKKNLTLKAELNTIEDFKNNIFIPKYGTTGKVEHITLGSTVDDVYIRSDDPNFSVRYSKRGDSGFTSSSAVGVGVIAQARSSPINIFQNFEKKQNDIIRSLPKGMNLSIIDNTAEYIKASVNAVYRSLFEAILFVFLVILLFLRSVRATIIPMVTIPICLIGGFAVMYFMGYTLNLLTLLAMVLATGLVVDDAVVVLENIYKYIEKGYGRVQASIMGTKEIQFSVIAMTLTLAAVYAPISLVPGLVGNVFSEFAFTLTGTVLISGFTALILSPMMCARLLEREEQETQSSFWMYIADALSKLEDWYSNKVKFALKHIKWVFTIVCFLSVSAFLLARYSLPSTLSPTIDSGRFTIMFQIPSGIKMQELDTNIKQLEKLVEKIDEVDSYYTQVDTLGGTSKVDVYLKQKSGQTCEAILRKYDKMFATQSPMVLSNIRPICRNIRLAGGDNSQDFVLSVQSNKDYNSLSKLGERLAHSLNAHKGIIDRSVRFDRTAKISSYTLVPDRKKAASLGVGLDSLQELNSLSRGIQAGYFEKEFKKADVYVKTSDSIDIDEILRFDVRSKSNRGQGLVSLGELVSLEKTYQRPALPHQGGMRSFTIFAETDPNYGLGVVYDSFREVIDKTLPDGYRVEPIGGLRDYIEESSNIAYIILLALVFIYLIMAAQFESFMDPFIIMGTVPLSWVGAIFLLSLISDGSLNIFSGIGLLTLVGLITKHGILIVDFANKNLEKKMELHDAIIDACITRFRPILMTTAAMVLGAVPLALAGGIGYEIRRQIGVVIVGGMTFGTIFTLFFIPCMYVVLKKYAMKKIVDTQE